MKRCSYLLGLLFFFFNSFAVMQAGAMEEMKRDRGDLDPRDAAKENSAANRIIAGQHQRTPSGPQSGSMTVNAESEKVFSSPSDTVENDPLKFTSPNVTDRPKGRRSSAKGISNRSEIALTAEILEELAQNSAISEDFILSIVQNKISFIDPTSCAEDPSLDHEVVLAAVESAFQQKYQESAVTTGILKTNEDFLRDGLSMGNLRRFIQETKERAGVLGFELLSSRMSDVGDEGVGGRGSGWLRSMLSLSSFTRRGDTARKSLSMRLNTSDLDSAKHLSPLGAAKSQINDISSSSAAAAEESSTRLEEREREAQQKKSLERRTALDTIEREYQELHKKVDQRQSILDGRLASIEDKIGKLRNARKAQVARNLARGIPASAVFEKREEWNLAEQRRLQLYRATWDFEKDGYEDVNAQVDFFSRRRVAVYEDVRERVADYAVQLEEIRNIGRSIISFIDVQKEPSYELLSSAMRALRALEEREIFILKIDVSDMKNRAKDQLLKAKQEMEQARLNSTATDDVIPEAVTTFFNRNAQLLENASKSFLFAEARRSEALAVAATNIGLIEERIREIKSQIENDEVALGKVADLKTRESVSRLIAGKKSACDAFEEAIVAYDQLQNETFIQQLYFSLSLPLLKKNVITFIKILEGLTLNEGAVERSSLIEGIKKIFPDDEGVEIESEDPLEFLDRVLKLPEGNDRDEIIGNHGRFVHVLSKKLSSDEIEQASREEEAKESNSLLLFACCRLHGIDSVRRFNERFQTPISKHTLIEVKGIKKFMEDEERYHRSSLFLLPLPEDGIGKLQRHEVMLSDFMEELKRAPEFKVVKWHAPTMDFNPFDGKIDSNISEQDPAAIEKRDIEAGIEHAKEAVRKIFTREQLSPTEMNNLLKRFEKQLAERARSIEPNSGKITGLTVKALRDFIDAEKKKEYMESQGFWSNYDTHGLIESALKGIAYGTGSVGVAIIVPHLPLIVSGMGLGLAAAYVYIRYLGTAAAAAAETAL